MMKNLLVAILFTMSASAFSQVKIAVVNIQTVITSIKEGKAVMKTLESSFQSKQKILQKEEEELKKFQADFQKQDMVLSDKAKEKKREEFTQKYQALQKKTADFQKEIQKQEGDLKKPILDKLKSVIDAVSEEKKVDLTFELTSAPVIYAANKVDITDDVIKAYDKKHSK